MTPEEARKVFGEIRDGWAEVVDHPADYAPEVVSLAAVRAARLMASRRVKPDDTLRQDGRDYLFWHFKRSTLWVRLDHEARTAVCGVTTADYGIDPGQ